MDNINEKIIMLGELVSLKRKQLADSDYRVLKCNECALLDLPMPYNVEILHTERQDLRNQINVLEIEIRALEEEVGANGD